MPPAAFSSASQPGSGAAAPARLRAMAVGAGYVALYLALDWASYIYPLQPLGVTPWNPPPGLTMALLLTRGVAWAPLAFVAAWLAEILVRGAPAGMMYAVAASLVLGASYAAVGWALRRTLRLPFGASGRRDLVWFFAAAALGSLLAACGYVGVYVHAGVVPHGDFGAHVARFWIGDLIGIVVTTPCVLVLADAPTRRRLRASLTPGEGVAHLAAIGLSLAVIFGSGLAHESTLFYLLFLPLIWIAMRHGVDGTALGAVAIQLGLIVAVTWSGHSGASVQEFQFLMLALAGTGLFLGITVTERQRAQELIASRDEEFRSKQLELTRALRLAAAGEMASAVAHEINQPLSAVASYAKACRLMADDPAVERRELAEVMDKVVGETQRAAEVMRRLREFFRSGGTRLERVILPQLVEDALAPLRPRLARHGIRLTVHVAPDLRPALADPVQLRMVLHNLIANAIDALKDAPAPRMITLSLSPHAGGALRVDVEDNGPGVAPEMRERLFQPFTTSKGEGMGLGLAVCRSLVEAHGGKLWADTAGPGARFHFTLPDDSRRAEEEP